MSLVTLTTGRVDAAFAGALQNVTNSGVVNSGPTQSLGFDFKVNTATQIGGLGVYQAAGAQSIVGQTVVLQDVTTGVTIATAVITAGITTNAYNYALLATPLVLSGSDTFSIYSLFQGSSTQYGVASSIGTSPEITIVPLPVPNGGTANSGYTQGGLTAPTSGFNNLLSTNFLEQPFAVPEPASVIMLGLGLVVSGGAAFRKSRRISA